VSSSCAVSSLGDALDLAIARRGDDLLLGAVGIVNWAVEHRRAAAGYWLASYVELKGRRWDVAIYARVA
jgi:hypothetical protein